MQDLNDQTQIQDMVDSFYGQVRLDPILGPIFDGKIQDRWPQHLNTLYSFWGSVLLDQKSYKGFPFPPHAFLPIDQSHFDIWLSIFKKNLDRKWSGPCAEEAWWRAQRMAEVFAARISAIKAQNEDGSGSTPIV